MQKQNLLPPVNILIETSITGAFGGAVFGAALGIVGSGIGAAVGAVLGMAASLMSNHHKGSLRSRSDKAARNY
jgi:hypothetical protein